MVVSKLDMHAGGYVAAPPKCTQSMIVPSGSCMKHIRNCGEVLICYRVGIFQKAKKIYHK